MVTKAVDKCPELSLRCGRVAGYDDRAARKG